MLCLVSQSCLTLCNPMDHSLPGSSIHGNSPDKNTGVSCHALLQGIFPTQGSKPSLPYYRQILYHPSHQGSLYYTMKWQPTPVFMPGKSHGPRSLVGYSPWGRNESDTTDFTSHFLTKEVIEYYFLGTYLNQVPRSPLITFLILPSQNWNLNIGKIK